MRPPGIRLSESDVQRQIMDYVRIRHFAWRNNTGGRPWTDNRGSNRLFRFGKVGSGDIFLIARPTGRFVSIEVKRRGAKATPEQEDFIRRVEEAGGMAFVAYSLEDVISRGL